MIGHTNTKGKHLSNFLGFAVKLTFRRGSWEKERTMDILPPENLVVETKIDDGVFVRNEQPLYRYKNLWYVPDGSMYVYYTPTHWREIL